MSWMLAMVLGVGTSCVAEVSRLVGYESFAIHVGFAPYQMALQLNCLGRLGPVELTGALAWLGVVVPEPVRQQTFAVVWYVGWHGINLRGWTWTWYHLPPIAAASTLVVLGDAILGWNVGRRPQNQQLEKPAAGEP